jgi:predicted adenine nucleotide alpha hydrolase (AANH) superfamily ATPase
MKILLHMCCGPCASAIIDFLQNEGHEVYGYFYNPNIHPLVEYRKRKESAYKIAKIKEVKMIGDPQYGLKEYLREVVFRENKRCYLCYNMRISETARLARKGKFDAFTTSLLISPYQNHEQIIELAKISADRENVKFYYHDFRELFKRSLELSNEHDLYRQQYCGCIYSEEERYRNQKNIE